LQEADLGDGDVGELGLEDPQHLADAHRPGGIGRGGPLARGCGPLPAAPPPRPGPGASPPPPPGRGGTLRWTGSRISLPATPGSTAGEEHQLELADLELVAGDALALLHPRPVQVGAVQGADVVDGEAAGATADLGVAARDGDLVEEDVALGGAPGGRRLPFRQ